MSQSKSTVLLALVLTLPIAFFGCKKSQAKRDLVGDWTVTGYTGILLNACDERGEYYDEAGSIYGTITFDQRMMKRDYALLADTGDCYAFADFDDLVRWKVSDYTEQLTIAHQYTLDIDGLSWNLFFGDEAVGELPSDQEMVYLSHISNNGDAISIELTRDAD
ncbi:MAG: hypothetical protein RLP15_06515 [Cryomorphaceae bacterium]